MHRLRPRRVPLDLLRLSTRDDIFRLSGAVEQDPNVGACFMDGLMERRSIAQTWLMQMRWCGDDDRELMHDGCPVACVEDAPFGYVNSFKNHVNVGLFHGPVLEDPTGRLEGGGKRMRHVKLKPARPLSAAALGGLIDAAYLAMRACAGRFEK